MRSVNEADPVLRPMLSLSGDDILRSFTTPKGPAPTRRTGYRIQIGLVIVLDTFL